MLLNLLFVWNLQTQKIKWYCKRKHLLHWGKLEIKQTCENLGAFILLRMACCGGFWAGDQNYGHHMISYYTYQDILVHNQMIQSSSVSQQEGICQCVFWQMQIRGSSWVSFPGFGVLHRRGSCDGKGPKLHGLWRGLFQPWVSSVSRIMKILNLSDWDLGCLYLYIYIWVCIFLGSATLSKAGKFDFGETDPPKHTPKQTFETDPETDPLNLTVRGRRTVRNRPAKQTPETYHETDPRNRPLRQTSRPGSLILRHTHIYIYK